MRKFLSFSSVHRSKTSIYHNIKTKLPFNLYNFFPLRFSLFLSHWLFDAKHNQIVHCKKQSLCRTNQEETIVTNNIMETAEEPNTLNDFCFYDGRKRCHNHFYGLLWLLIMFFLILLLHLFRSAFLGFLLELRYFKLKYEPFLVFGIQWNLLHLTFIEYFVFKTIHNRWNFCKQKYCCSFTVKLKWK